MSLYFDNNKLFDAEGHLTDEGLYAIKDTIKIKKITMWRLLFLHAFILMIGRIINILAPVVPIQLDNKIVRAHV